MNGHLTSPGEAYMEKRKSAKSTIVMGLLGLIFGSLFLLPHWVRIAEIGSYQAYSPFTSHSYSSVVWDESFLYAAQANYSLTRNFGSGL
jgi:hypothetical protein